MPDHLRSIWDPQYRPLPCRPGSVTPSKQDSLPDERPKQHLPMNSKMTQSQSELRSSASASRSTAIAAGMRSQSQRAVTAVLGSLATDARRRSPAGTGTLERATERVFDQFIVHSRYFAPSTRGDESDAAGDADAAGPASRRLDSSAEEDEPLPLDRSAAEDQRENGDPEEAEGEYEPQAEDENTLVSEAEDVEPQSEGDVAAMSDAEDIELPAHVLLGTRALDDSTTESLSFTSPTRNPAAAGAQPQKRPLSENSSSFDSLSCTSPPPLLPSASAAQTPRAPSDFGCNTTSPSARNVAIGCHRVVSPVREHTFSSSARAEAISKSNFSKDHPNARSKTGASAMTPPPRDRSSSPLMPAQSRSAQSTSVHSISISRPTGGGMSAFLDAFRYSKKRSSGSGSGSGLDFFTRGNQRASDLSGILEQYETSADKEPHCTQQRVAYPIGTSCLEPATASSSVTSALNSAAVVSAASTGKRSNVFASTIEGDAKRPRAQSGSRSASRHAHHSAIPPDIHENDLFSSGTSVASVQRNRIELPHSADAAEEPSSDEDVLITRQDPAAAPLGHHQSPVDIDAVKSSSFAQRVSSPSSSCSGSNELIARYLNSLAQAPPLSATGSFHLSQRRAEEDEPPRGPGSSAASSRSAGRRSLQSTPVQQSGAVHRLSGGSASRTPTAGVASSTPRSGSGRKLLTSTPRGQRSITQFIAGFQAKKA